MSAASRWKRLSEGGWDAVQALWEEGERESVHLEFKRAQWNEAPQLGNDDRKNISRSISAFANTEGGVLIFGVEAKGNVATGPKLIAKAERFAALVESRVLEATTPTVEGVHVLPILDSSNSGAGVVVVYVPYNEGGPFRASGAQAEVNDRYYIRTAESCAVMPHATLADRFGRSARPDLRLLLRLTPDGSSIQVFLRNEGRGVAQRPAIEFQEEPRNCDFGDRGERDWHIVGRFARDARFLLACEASNLIYPQMEQLVIYIGRAKRSPHEDPWVVPLSGRIYALNIQPVVFEGTFDTDVTRHSNPLVMPPEEARAGLHQYRRDRRG